MRERAEATRTTLAQEHLETGSPFSFEKLFRSAAFRPSSDAALRRLIRRGAFDVTADGLSNRGRAVDAPFTAQLQGEAFRFTVTIPEVAVIVIEHSATVTRLTLPDGWLLVFIDPIVINGVELPLASRQRLTAITVDRAAMRYLLVSDANPAEELELTVTFGEMRTTSYVRASEAAYADFTCTCCMERAPSDGYYVLRSPTGCDAQYLGEGDYLKLQNLVAGPFDSPEEANTEIEDLVRRGVCTGRPLH